MLNKFVLSAVVFVAPHPVVALHPVVVPRPVVAPKPIVAPKPSVAPKPTRVTPAPVFIPSHRSCDEKKEKCK